MSEDAQYGLDDIVTRILAYDSSNGGYSEAANGDCYELMKEAAGTIVHLRGLLEDYQWAQNGSSMRFCPCCNKTPSAGHAENCEIKHAITK